MAASSSLSPLAPSGATLPDQAPSPPDVEGAHGHYLVPVIAPCDGCGEQRGAVAGRLGLYFPDRATYDAWAQRVDDEAPGLRTRLLTIDAPDGGHAVFFQLVDQRSPLTADGVDALCDVARRLVACRPARRGA